MLHLGCVDTNILALASKVCLPTTLQCLTLLGGKVNPPQGSQQKRSTPNVAQWHHLGRTCRFSDLSENHSSTPHRPSGRCTLGVQQHCMEQCA